MFTASKFSNKEKKEENTRGDDDDALGILFNDGVEWKLMVIQKVYVGM